MAFFKFRKGDDAKASSKAPTESVEVLRRRARHRLIGAAVLVLLGVVGFPLLFDTQPRPIAVDIPIEIPDRNKVRPLPAPLPTAPRAEARASAPVPAVAQAPASTPAPLAVAKAEPAPEARVEPKPDPRPEPKPAPREPAREAKAEPARPAPAPKAAEGARAEALLEGKAVEGRFVVQVGAFADAAKARETRLRVEKAGLKTYTHVAETKDGRRIRVRVGPFPTRAAADKAASRIKELDLPAAVLTL